MTALPGTSSPSRPGQAARLLLGIDCATPYLALALVDRAGDQVAALSLEVGRDHAARLLPELQLLLAGAGVTGRDVAAIGVGVGPGSYTGVRVAIASARGLARAWNVPMAGSSSLLALLPTASATAGALAPASAPAPTDAMEPGERGVALLDARRGNVYVVLAERRNSPEPRFRVVEGPLKMPRQELDERFANVPRFEAGAPNAAVLAFAALDGGATEALYL